MILANIWIQSLRNIANAHLVLHPRCNVIVGKNGSGKTSILEAIYLLSRGQSFKTRSIAPLVEFTKSKLSISAKSCDEAAVLLEKDLKGNTFAYIDGKRCQRISELTKLFPCQLFHHDLFQIIDSSSQIRRKLLDWGLFYQSSDYKEKISDFKKVLLQRNFVLKNNGSAMELRAWNKMFIELSVQINEFRQQYVNQLSEAFQQELGRFNPEFGCEIKYHRGWGAQLTLEESLIKHEELDRKFGYTRFGPQHADLFILGEHGKGKLEWSRGQQKLILILLKIAQVKLLEQNCLFLFDDLLAELDEQKLHSLYELFGKINGQFILTVLDDAAKDTAIFKDSRWFYLKEGAIDKIIDY